MVGTGVVAQSLKPVTRFSYVQKDATPNIVGPTMLGVVASVCTLLYLKSLFSTLHEKKGSVVLSVSANF